MLSKDRKKTLAELAEFIALENNNSHIIDVRKIAKDNDITFTYGNYEDSFDGLLQYIREQDQFHIYCNLDRLGSQDAPRARFTFAHELGHYFIDEHRAILKYGKVNAHQSMCEFESEALVEKEADFFASRLLMPTLLVRNYLKKKQLGLEVVSKFSAQFQVSLTAAAIRTVEESNKGCCIIKWNNEGIGWRFVSPVWISEGFNTASLNLAAIPKDSALGQLLNYANAATLNIVEKGSTASMWFRNISPASMKNIILKEQAISLGRFGYLTFLFEDE